MHELKYSNTDHKIQFTSGAKVQYILWSVLLYFSQCILLVQTTEQVEALRGK